MKNLALLLVAGFAVFSTGIFNSFPKANATSHSGIAAGITQAQDTMVLGKLYFVNLEEGEEPVMTALSLFGNCCGSESFNHKPYATEGIRSVFELDEWIEFHPLSNVGAGIKVMVFRHIAEQGLYLGKPLDDETPGYIQECELNRDPDEETNHWGSFYLHPQEVEPGLYDFVFIYGDKVFATMLTRFYKPEELQGKQDSELEQLMSQSQ